MKKLLLLSSALFFLSTCDRSSKEEIPIEPPQPAPESLKVDLDTLSVGSFVADKDGEIVHWKADGYIFTDFGANPNVWHLLGNSVGMYMPGNINFIMHALPFKPAKLTIKKFTGYYFGGHVQLTDSDIHFEEYGIDTSKIHEFEIVHFDSTKMEASGRFEAHFAIQPPKLHYQSPDSIHFNSGFFKVKIQ